MFKNALIYGLGFDHVPTFMVADTLDAGLAEQQYRPPAGQEVMSMGWAPLDNVAVEERAFAHMVGTHILMRLRVGKRILPGKAVLRAVAAECAKIEAQQGFRPGRKQTKEIKEKVICTMLPSAFIVETDTWVWFDHAAERLVIDAASVTRADEVLQLLNKSVERLSMRSLHVNLSPSEAMTEWVGRDEAPEGFTIDQDTEFQSSGEGRAKVRYQYGSVEAEQARSHIEAGKHVTRLAMTWADRISFVLTETLALKRIAPLDVMKEGGAMAESFDGEFLLIAGEMSKLISDLIAALAGLKAD